MVTEVTLATGLIAKSVRGDHKKIWCLLWGGGGGNHKLLGTFYEGGGITKSILRKAVRLRFPVIYSTYMYGIPCMGGDHKISIT